MTDQVYLDASVLVAIFTNDALTARAVHFLTNASLTYVVGTFASAEFSSAVGRKVRMTTMNAAEAAISLSRFDVWAAAAPQRVGVINADVLEADRLLRRFDLKLRVGDALNLAIAQRLGLPLATFDLGMARAAGVVGIPLIPC